MSGNPPNERVVMVRPDLRDVPEVDLPTGYSIVPYRPGDEHHWLSIQQAAETFLTITLDTWEREFGFDPPELHRQLFLWRRDRPVGTTSAWYGDDTRGREVGRIHWVAIVPDCQGRGLAKPLLAGAMQLLAKLGHHGAYLVTSTGRLPAINLYLTFGFQPELTTPEDRRAWAALRGRLPALEPYL